MFSGGMRSKTIKRDVDYSYYLGPNYKEGYKSIVRTSTIVCNHVSWFDPPVLILELRPAFVPILAYSKVPLFKTTINGLESFYIYSGPDAEKRSKVI